MLSWPIEINLLRGYVNWALTSKKLNLDTVKVYLLDLKTAHKIRNLEPKFKNDFFHQRDAKGRKRISIFGHHEKIQICDVIPFAENNWP